MARSLRIFAFLFASLAASGATAAPWTTDGLDDYLITRVDRAGDATGLVISMVQDRDGYLWLGSADGLFRFDGFAFQKWADISPAPLAGTSVRRTRMSSRLDTPPDATTGASVLAHICLRSSTLGPLSMPSLFSEEMFS